MIILGVCNANYSGVSLIFDGKLVTAANEERFCRKKLFQGFPEKSIEWVLRSQEYTVSDVDWVGCVAWAGMDSKHTLPRLVEDIFEQVKEPIW
jgi:predicted NodU family carbamoyl transferase